MRIATVFLAALVSFAAEMALVQPKELAPQISTKGPVVIQVGPNVLYRSKHIPGALYAGPGNTPAGIALLRSAVEKLPHDREIVIYCGCCPWDVCPNIKPAMEVLRTMGFSRVKALYLPTNFKKDWIDVGLPTQ
jgi:hypothetical protein